MHLAQSRAVSEAVPIMLWINSQTGAYGMAAENSGQSGSQNSDPKAETLTVDSTLAIAVLNTGGRQTLFNGQPAIRFLVDGTIDESSPQTLRLTDSDGFSRLLTETRCARDMRLPAHHSGAKAGAARRNVPGQPSRATPHTAGFTLAEVLAALMFLAIVIPTAVEALHVASLAGEVAAGKSEAARVADRVLNESIVTPTGATACRAARSRKASWIFVGGSRRRAGRRIPCSGSRRKSPIPRRARIIRSG